VTAQPDKDVAGGRYLRGRPAAIDVARRWVLIGLGVAGLLFLLYPIVGENGLATYLRLREERAQLRHEVEDLKLRQAELQQRIDALQEDPAELERMAREHFNMRREGEKVIVVRPEQDDQRDP